MTDITDLLSLIPRMRHGGMGEGIVRAGLIAEGWPRKDVDAAFAALERGAQSQVARWATHVPQTAGIALTGQNSGASE